MNVIAELKGKNKQELKQRAQRSVLNCRIWVQENGEKALLAGFVGGIIFTICFKFFFWVLVLLALGGMGIGYLAPEEAPSVSIPERTSADNDTGD